ncbi:MAG: hypothetical protein ACMVO5_03720 [Polymorphobacter sp.]|uniref:hypothetical protein n=1 Tax=Polymorphobacter sp. TaxID=1909290 RepID=UPI003A843BE0
MSSIFPFDIPETVRRESLVLLDSDEWLIGAPLTFWASMCWGRGTDWCTACDLTAFEIYHRQGPLLVFRQRYEGGCWQLHPATREFRNGQNRLASWRGFLGHYPVICGALFAMGESL